VQWKDADSRVFLRHCAGLARARGYAAGNADVSVVCEQPRLAAHVDAMRQNLADDLGWPTDDVSVKGTTSERLGFTGRGEGIAASAVVLLLRGRAGGPADPGT
jgi:2-C-methyl-D-erythritol 2,4-cyclodiphosphate synthase